jgi:8-oxo-dGTP pyrophosphatase MutT (NUDIX family)
VEETVRLPFDPEDPPSEPPAGADPLMWRLAYTVHSEHLPEWEGWCKAPSCRGIGARWRCRSSKLAALGLATAMGARAPQLFPVSVKGVVIRDGRVLLLRNERDEWELPGGKLDLGEDPASCVVREIAEEVGWTVTAGPVLDVWQYHIRAGVDVVIVTYGCHTSTDGPPVVSSEHLEVGLFAENDVAALRMPDGYKKSIAAWYAQSRSPGLEVS